MPTLIDVIGVKPGRERSVVRRGLSTRFDDQGVELPAVDPTGGRWGAGIIRGASLMATGEALGHERYVDAEAIRQTVELGNGSDSGVKVRFTHPGLSSDGFGSYLGRGFDLQVSEDGTQAIGDIHFAKSSRNTPDGDRGGYVLELAGESPDAFGMSIVFDHLPGAESDFVMEHTKAGDDGESRFESPDAANVKNFPHVRLAKLHGADFVDEPAANPDGLFHTGPSIEILDQAEKVIEYALGISDEAPNLDATGGVSADRLRGYLSRFLDGRGLVLKLSGGSIVADENTLDTPTELAAVETPAVETPTDLAAVVETPAVEETPAKPAELSLADLQRFRDKFGDANAAKYLAEGLTFEQGLDAELDAARLQLSTRATSRGEETAVDEFADGGGKPAKRKFAGSNIPIRFVSSVPMAGPEAN